MPVTKDPETALRHLRLGDRQRGLWVDAICINQADMPERMQQVSHMNIIYSKAEKTLFIWVTSITKAKKVSKR